CASRTKPLRYWRQGMPPSRAGKPNYSWRAGRSRLNREGHRSIRRSLFGSCRLQVFCGAHHLWLRGGVLAQRLVSDEGWPPSDEGASDESLDDSIQKTRCVHDKGNESGRCAGSAFGRECTAPWDFISHGTSSAGL